MKRATRASMGQETAAILRLGSYVASNGERVDLTERLRASVAGTRVIRPEAWDGIVATAIASGRSAVDAVVEVSGETTLAAIFRLVETEKVSRVAVLNIASAKNPGGGFLSGSQAQEESLARCSGLYATLTAGSAYYDANRRSSNKFYTDHAIYSPDVPIFRDDEDGRLLGRPYAADFITMPAVNFGALPQSLQNGERVAVVMRRRMECVLALAATHGANVLVLGAWGCGVFRNDPELIAMLFARCLTGDRSWRSRFERIVFAVLDTTADQRNRKAFERHLCH